MNFYKHHIGDYAKKTGALTMIEHGAYLLMLHAYYGTEKPLPIGRDLYRICRAFGKKERQSVDRVLGLFWTKTDAGYINGRAFEEMEAASDAADSSRNNGKKGGRPKKVTGNPTGFGSTNPSGSDTEPDAKAIQTPDSRHQTPVQKTSLPPFDPSTIAGLDVSAWHEWVEYRDVRRPKIKAVSKPKAAKAMAKLGGGQRAAVDYSIANGYQGLIEPKTNGKHGGPAQNDDAAWAEARSAAKEIGFRDPWPQESANSYLTAVKMQRDSPPRRSPVDVSKLTGQMRFGK